MGIIDILGSIGSSFEISQKISECIKSNQADVQIIYVGFHEKFNEIEVVNQGEGIANSVQINICDVDNSECYWENTDNSLTYTFLQMQAHESHKLSIAYWGFQNKDVKVQIIWTDKRGKEHHKDMTLQLLGICD